MRRPVAGPSQDRECMEMGSQFSPQSLEGLRRCLRPELTGMPAEDLEQIVNTSISEMPASTAADFMRALGALAKAAGPTLQRAVPSITQGATTGASVGGPWGALFGAGAGLASAALSGQGRPSRPAAPAPGVTASPSSTGPAPALGVTASPSSTGPPETPVAPALPTG